ncbi:MAG: hypothetical protein ABFD15_05945, partial [Methanofastidiosum sp.]
MGNFPKFADGLRYAYFNKRLQLVDIKTEKGKHHLGPYPWDGSYKHMPGVKNTLDDCVMALYPTTLFGYPIVSMGVFKGE